MTLTEALSARLPDRPYLIEWFRHRDALTPWPSGNETRWIGRAAQSIKRWSNQRDLIESTLDRQEKAKMDGLRAATLSVSAAASYVVSLYPAARSWDRTVTDDADHRSSLLSQWQRWRDARLEQIRRRADAAELPEFHSQLWVRIRKLAEAESAVHSLLTDRDLGWDLEQGEWQDLDFSPLVAAAEVLKKEPMVQRIAELLGRDYRSKSRPPLAPPVIPPSPLTEPGRTEIRGIRFGNDWAAMVSSDAALLGFSETQDLFFKKAAEAELLIWDSSSPAPPLVTDTKRSQERRKKNERGPLVLALDTSGSMRGKPEEVAKAMVLALLRIALEEERACYLINFSSQQRCLDLSQVGTNLAELLRFLKFSFHGGTDLPPALRECLRVLEESSFREADVLVISDFAVPKIPQSVRTAIRRQQEGWGTKFYSLTVSVRPLNDFLNVFDAGWVYNIHPFQINGIAPESLEALG